MPEQPPARPALTAKALAAKVARAEREAAALRENLRKRKEQDRSRRTETDLAPPKETPTCP